jgi:hypothetical protein
MNSAISFDDLKAQAVALGDEQRGELASVLLASLHPEAHPDPDFRQRLSRRVEELRSGKVQGISAKDAFASLDD